MILSEELEKTLYRAYEQAKKRKHEFITPEHILLELLDDTSASDALLDCGLDLETLRNSIDEFFENNMPPIDSEYLPEPEYSAGSKYIMRIAAMHAESADKQEIDGSNLLISLFRLPESQALYLLLDSICTDLSSSL